MSPGQFTFAILALAGSQVLTPVPEKPDGKALDCFSRPGTSLVCWRPAEDPPEILRLPWRWPASEPELRFADNRAPIKTLGPWVGEKPKLTRKGRAAFAFQEDGKAIPVLGVGFQVRPLSSPPGELPRGIVTCDFFARVRDVGKDGETTVIVHETAFKCDGRFYVVTGLYFQGD